ncbi:MAG: hypothetical protein JNM94_00200 [Phycisphaerae bacterium]|nr:hypothetical protein [Phycisphaerae bacterium]
MASRCNVRRLITPTAAFGFAFAASAALERVASGEVVFCAVANNGYVVPFNPNNWATVGYGDAGWISSEPSDPIVLSSVTMKMATFLSSTAGSADLVFTLHDGDPTGLGPGSGAALYEVTIPGLALPAAPYPTSSYFDLTIPLPDIALAGGANNIGWSVRVSTFAYPGCLGFQLSNCNGQLNGFATTNACAFDGKAWSHFGLGSGCNGVANFAVTFESAPALDPCPADLDDSGTVDAQDLGALLGQWGTAGSADLDDNGVVDSGDLGILLGGWGSCN